MARRRSASGRIVVLGVVLLCALCTAVFGQPWDGNGVEGDPYQIWDANDMQAIGGNSAYWGAHFELMADINLAAYTGTSFNIIGNGSSYFSGVFDGNDHVVRNLDINAAGIDYMGLFGYTDTTAEIKNLNLVGASIYNLGTCSATGILVGYNRGTILKCYTQGNITADESTGGLVGYNNSGTISDCYSEVMVRGGGFTGGLLGYNNSGVVTDSHATGDVTGTGNIGGLLGRTYYGTVSNCYASGSVTQDCPLGCFYAGGLVGRSYYGTIENCHASGQVNGSTVFGGLIGINYGGTVTDSHCSGQVIGGNSNDLGSFAGVNQFGTISRCYATGNALSNGDVVGGFVGLNTNESLISNCYSSGDAQGAESIGPMAGASGSDSLIINCYSSGSASGDANVGGFIGEGSSGEGLYTACFWDSDVNPDVNGIGNGSDPNVIGETTVEMQTESTFTDAGWDFVGEVINGPNDIWEICEGTNYPKFVWQIPAGDLACPDGVTLVDFSVLGAAWYSGPGDGNWDPNCDISEPNDNLIDERDLRVFAGSYLEGIR